MVSNPARCSSGACHTQKKEKVVFSMSVAAETTEVKSSKQLIEEKEAAQRPWGLTPQDLIIYLMIFPAVLMYVVFTYIPMPGMLVAFCEYTASKGFKKWVGFENLIFIFNLPRFGQALRNNLIYAGLGYLINFPAPIILALLFNELKLPRFKKAVQTLMTIPNFISWIVIAGIFKILLDPDYGWVNALIYTLGGNRIYFLGDPGWFPFAYVCLSLWKSVGYGSILYLATMASIDNTLYEAAAIDGAGRWRQTWHVTLPGIKGIVLLKLILSFGGILNLFDSMFVLKNRTNAEVAIVLDTLVYEIGIQEGNFAQSQAMGFFKLVIGAIITVIVNETAKKLSDDGRGIF